MKRWVYLNKRVIISKLDLYTTTDVCLSTTFSINSVTQRCWYIQGHDIRVQVAIYNKTTLETSNCSNNTCLAIGISILIKSDTMLM